MIIYILELSKGFLLLALGITMIVMSRKMKRQNK